MTIAARRSLSFLSNMNGWPLLARSRWLVPGPAICVASRDWLDLLSPYKDQLGSASSWPFFFVLGELLQVHHAEVIEEQRMVRHNADGCEMVSLSGREVIAVIGPMA